MKKTLILVFVLFAALVFSGYAEEKRELPILMYHSVDDSGEDYSVSTEKLTMDIRALEMAGYTPVHFKEVIDFVYNGATLPEKPVVITFDDGYLNNYETLFPLVKELNVKIEIFAIGGAVEYSDGVFKWEMAREMEQSGLVNIGSHTYNLHDDEKGIRRGIGRIEGESFREWEHLFRTDLLWTQRFFKEELGKKPETFAYPFGNFSKEAETILAESGYVLSVSTEPGVNEITVGDPECLKLMYRISMDETKRFAPTVIRQNYNNPESLPIRNVKNNKAVSYASRADALRVIFKDDYIKKPKNLLLSDYYSDTDCLDDDTKAVMAYAVSEGLVSGFSDLTIRANHYITRGEFAVLLARYMKYTKTGNSTKFSDVSDWNRDAIAWCDENGYMIGYGETFGVDDFLTENQLKIVCMRIGI